MFISSRCGVSSFFTIPSRISCPYQPQQHGRKGLRKIFEPQSWGPLWGPPEAPAPAKKTSNKRKCVCFSLTMSPSAFYMRIMFFHNPQPYQLSLSAATAWQEWFAKGKVCSAACEDVQMLGKVAYYAEGLEWGHRAVLQGIVDIVVQYVKTHGQDARGCP